METKTHLFRFRKKIAVIFLVAIFVFSPATSPAKAWDAIPAAILKNTLEIAREIIHGIQMGAAKRMAMIALQQELTYLITGQSSGGPLFVTDWNDYLIQMPKDATNLIMNDFISQSLNGRGSMTGYVAVGTEGIGINTSYIGRLDQSARQLLQEPTCQIAYQGNPSQMFAGPNPFRQMNSYLNGNTPWAFSSCVSAKYQQVMEENILIAQTKVISPGILGKEIDGITVNPAGLIEAQIAKVQNMGIDIITAAENLPEIISSAVSATINQTIQQGIGNIQAQVHRQISNVRSQAFGQLNSMMRNAGPAAMFMNRGVSTGRSYGANGDRSIPGLEPGY